MSSVAILGAGSIGCFVGGMLARGGHEVVLLGRQRVVDEVRRHGLRLTSFDGLDKTVAADRCVLSDRPDVLARAAIVCIAVKSHDTAEAAELVANHASPEALVVSLQNGVGNVPAIRARLPGYRVLGGMVPFNVLSLGEGRFHRATSGDIVIEDDASATASSLSVPGLAIRSTDNIVGVQWGKLLVNLNNALNALSGLPIREQLAQRRWRRLMADQWDEALAVLRAESIVTVSTTPLPTSWTPAVLRLPDLLFAIVLGRTMKIDAAARSSMAEDLLRCRRTEIDVLQGVIVERAARHGLAVPISQRTLALIKHAEAAGGGLPNLTPEQVRTGGLS